MLNETVTRDAASSRVAQLTIFNHIRFWDQYSVNKESIFSETNKENEKILGG